MLNIYKQQTGDIKVKKISVFIFCLSAIVFLVSGCAVWKDLNTPLKKRKTTALGKPAAYKPETLPDGSTTGLNEYEKAYIDDIDKSFKRQQQINSRKVFGGSGR